MKNFRRNNEKPITPRHVSSPRKRGSSDGNGFWIPAFAGMTLKRTLQRIHHLPIIAILFIFFSVLSGVDLLAASKEKTGGKRPLNQPYGLGLIFGEPSGISGKAWLSRIMAIDGGLGWSFIDDTAIHLHGDVLFHHKPFSPHHGDFYFYGGLGARVRSGNNEKTGIRVPLGAEFMLVALPLDFFVEVVPILELVSSEDLGINSALGIRWMF